LAVSLEKSSTTSTKTKRDERASEAASKIVSVDEVEPHFKMCIYGRNKLGKTVFATSSELKTLVIDCNEHGHDSIRHLKNTKYYPAARWEDIDPIYWYLRGGTHDFEVVVIDTITMMASLGMKWVLKDDYERDMTRDPMTPNKQSYLKLGEMMKDAIIKFRNLPYHIVFNAQEKTTNEDDEEGNTVSSTHPELSPGPRSTLLSATNLIGRIYVREVEGKAGKKIMERRLLLGSHPKYISGNRFKELRSIERLPENEKNLQKFIDRVYGGKNAVADAS